MSNSTSNDESPLLENPAPVPKRHWGRWLFFLLTLGAIATGAWWQWRPVSNQSLPIYETAVIERGAIQRSVSATGSVQALVTVQIGSQLSGQLVEVRADFNSVVKKGELLALIDPKTYRSKVAQADADWRVARAGLDVQAANLKKAQAQARQKTQDLIRQRALAQNANVSKSALEMAETDLAVAEADIAVAQAQEANARALVAQKEAALNQARIDLERTEIRSSIDGVVIERAIDPGQTVAASLQSPVLFRIARNLTEVQIEAQVNEADIGNIREGQPVNFVVDAYPERHFNGSVRQKRLTAVTVNNVVTYTVIVQADNPERILLPGMTATAEIITGRRENVLRIPNEALRFTPASGNMPSETTGAGSGRGRVLRELIEVLKLSDEQRQAVESTLGNTRPAADAPPLDTETLRQKLEQALRRVTTPEQWTAYETWRTNRNETRPGKVWLLTPEGQLAARRVRLGVTDNRFSEVASGPIEDGDRLILRLRQIAHP